MLSIVDACLRSIADPEPCTTGRALWPFVVGAWLLLQPVGLWLWNQLTHNGRGCCDA